jgi:hypothetical protein
VLEAGRTHARVTPADDAKETDTAKHTTAAHYHGTDSGLRCGHRCHQPARQLIKSAPPSRCPSTLHRAQVDRAFARSSMPTRPRPWLALTRSRAGGHATSAAPPQDPDVPHTPCSGSPKMAAFNRVQHASKRVVLLIIQLPVRAQLGRLPAICSVLAVEAHRAGSPPPRDSDALQGTSPRSLASPRNACFREHLRQVYIPDAR